MDYPGNGDGNHSPPWDDGTKKRKTTSGVGNSAAGRRAIAAAEEAERYNQVAGHYLTPPQPGVEVVFASNPFDDSPRPQCNHAPPPHLPQQLLAAPPRAPPPECPYGFAPQALPQPPRARAQQAWASRAKPKSRDQPAPYPGDPGPVINTKSRMLMGGGNVNVQHPPPQQPGVDGLGMPQLPARMCGPNLAPFGSLDRQPGAMMPPPPGPLPGKPARKRKACLTPPPVQPYCPPVVWGRDGQARYQLATSQLDPCYIGGLPHDSARCAANGLLAAPILHGQLTQEPPRPRSPQLLDECAGCRGLVSSNEEPIWCRAGCGLAYHRRCTNLHETAHYLMTNTPNVAWMCQTCEENKPDIEWIKSGQ